MEPDTYAARTLAELPTHPSAYRRDAYQRTCLNMISTGIHKWGFVVYRCTYDDDELWNRYLAQLKSFCSANLLEKRRAELLEQYLDWVVIDDRATLDNASQPEVRKHFNQWVSEQNVPTLPVTAITNRSPIQLPRFQYCLYVDKQCLDTVIQFQEANDGTALFIDLLPPMVFAIVDRTWTLEGTESDDGDDRDEAESEEDEDEEDEIEDGGGCPLIDGSDRRYVGWVYCNAFYVGGLYETLHQRGLHDDETFPRPPAIYPCGDRSMPS
ncbi:hypothetical protein CH63R_03554 [Colletotrichum higginsianum IMI 349063]|uniref:Uncharacterized protein n=1 Tax=Colletotrichum higginsianum (strain IMI 349063) TaxID=759273 RepID=A0A1B7YHF6_COLHI|nr:hypothetical protein CH63R_03554 [Colletotrichum higginsianum IMI 349063]OBR11258.1 hypothetical protein CH63R_03554 [Colletotrichum higginsianum IMI 349063]